jgi:hypothetical protein
MLIELFLTRFNGSGSVWARAFSVWWTLSSACRVHHRWSESRRVIEAMIAGQRIPMAIRKDTLDQLLEGAIRKRFSIRTTYSTS